MNAALPLPDNKKLMVTYRVEPGCLGPEGATHIRKFCKFAEKGVADVDSDFVRWHIVPRFNKTVSEMRYTVNRKMLTHDKANQYLQMFGKSLDDFEEHLQEKLALLVDDYFER
jgi:hypothetical protein